MPTDALANPLVLPMLGLLAEGPRHAYAVYTGLRDRCRHLSVRNATVYTLLNTLQTATWIAPDPVPERPSFALTATGREELARRVQHDLLESDLAAGTSFMTALAYLSILTAEHATDTLSERHKRLGHEATRIRAVLDDADTEPVHMIEAAFYLDRLEHEQNWISTTMTQIDNGTLRWPSQPQPNNVDRNTPPD